MQKCGEIVLNPKTGRAVKIGSRTYIRLVKEGVLKNKKYVDDNILLENPTKNNIEMKIQELNEKLPPGIHTVRGRGKYKNKLVKRKKRLKQEPECIEESIEEMIEKFILEDDTDPYDSYDSEYYEY